MQPIKMLLILSLILQIVGCAIYDAKLVNATAEPRSGTVAVSFNREGEEDGKKMARKIMRKFCSPNSYGVTAIDMSTATNSKTVGVPVSFMGGPPVIVQRTRSESTHTNQPYVHFQCLKEDALAASTGLAF